MANGFQGLLRQRIFELLFAADPKSEEMLAASTKFHLSSFESLRSRVKKDCESTSWMEPFIGKYHCAELGPAAISKTGDRFYIAFESWGSELASESQSDGGRVMVLITPPWRGNLPFQPQSDTGSLLLNAGQEKYIFERQTAAQS
jgi:hypothetical protein